MSRRTLPLWSTGFYCERADGTGAGGSFDVASALRHSRGLVRDLSELSQKISAKPSQQFPTKISADPGYRGPDRGRRDVSAPTCLPAARGRLWWACRCARASSGHFAGDSAARCWPPRAWVKEPDDERRQAALGARNQGHCDDALTWVALAAGWAGGLLGSGPHLSIRCRHT